MAQKTPLNPLVAIIGATGTGKSQLAVSLARRFNGEIINGDAMQMYQGLPVITNKIPVAEQGGIQHHLLDLVGYDELPWHVGVFARESLKITKGIHDRGKVPILVGGTHYYTKALLFKESLVGDAAEQDSLQASDAEHQWPILSASTEEMLAKLTEVDPVMARRWHPNDRRKIRRSLEIWLQNGRPASEIYTEQNAPKNSSLRSSNVGQDKDTPGSSGSRYPTLIFWLKSEKDALSARLDARVDKMIHDGLVHESETLHKIVQNRREAGIEDDMSRGIWVSIGYKELVDYITMSQRENANSKQLGDIKSKSIERIKIATRQYAKSQDRFIRSRLMGDIVHSGLLSNLFVLDCSSASSLEANIVLPATSVTEAFLGCKDIPDPKELSPLARETLSTIEENIHEKRNAGIPQCYTCEACGKVLQTTSAWESHLVSRKHRQTIAAQKREGAKKPQLHKENIHDSNGDTDRKGPIE